MITIFTLRKACLAFILFLGASALSAHHRGVNVSIDDGREPTRCEDINIFFDETPAQRATETLHIANGPNVTLRVQVPSRSGIRVVGSDRSDFEVQACKAAVSKADLSRIAVSHNGGELIVQGPEEETWAAYLLIQAPRDATLDLEAESAPIGLRNLSGRVTARTVNGPISLKDCSGEVDAEAENGPIHLSGSGGHLRLRTENGPIGVSLSGSAWKGQGVEARAVNGPVHLAIPAGYRSGAIVESLGHSPFECRGEGCASARRTWDDSHKRLELGEGPAVVRLSTSNGPVSVRSGDASRGASRAKEADEADEDDEE